MTQQLSREHPDRYCREYYDVIDSYGFLQATPSGITRIIKLPGESGA